jgi:hypothetical protein
VVELKHEKYVFWPYFYFFILCLCTTRHHCVTLKVICHKMNLLNVLECILLLR